MMKKRNYNRPEMEYSPVAEEFMTNSIGISNDIYHDDDNQGDFCSWSEFFS